MVAVHPAADGPSDTQTPFHLEANPGPGLGSLQVFPHSYLLTLPNLLAGISWRGSHERGAGSDKVR